MYARPWRGDERCMQRYGAAARPSSTAAPLRATVGRPRRRCCCGAQNRGRPQGSHDLLRVAVLLLRLRGADERFVLMPRQQHANDHPYGVHGARVHHHDPHAHRLRCTVRRGVLDAAAPGRSGRTRTASTIAEPVTSARLRKRAPSERGGPRLLHTLARCAQRGAAHRYLQQSKEAKHLNRCP